VLFRSTVTELRVVLPGLDSDSVPPFMTWLTTVVEANAVKEGLLDCREKLTTETIIADADTPNATQWILPWWPH